VSSPQFSFSHPDELSKFIHYRTYARWLNLESRRESATEAILRYLEWLDGHCRGRLPTKTRNHIEANLFSLANLPSMRLLWSAGEPVKVNAIQSYNCSYLPIKDLFCFSELFYILMCATGVGYSVERQYVSQLPVIQQQLKTDPISHRVADSKEGWAEALRMGLETWSRGKDINFDYSLIRPKGARLKTGGGRASGPDPLRELLAFVRQVFLKAQGRKLSSIEAHDICCNIADIVQVGGVRRAAMIAFFDFDDEAMLHCKRYPDQYDPVNGINPYRARANNSVALTSEPTELQFMKLWTALKEGGSGEPGLLFVHNIEQYLERREFTPEFRTNPCGEIILRPFEFCNLSSIIVRPSDSFQDIIGKAKVATWLGAVQATLTKFPYIRKEWAKNCEEERLLGVSLNGQLGNPRIMSDEKLEILKNYVLRETDKACKAFDINMSAAVTCGKPEGTGSLLVGCNAGMKPDEGEYMVRRVRVNAIDPLCKLMRAQGATMVPDNDDQAKLNAGEFSIDDVRTWVVEFPVKRPKNAIFKKDFSAQAQLEWYRKVQKNWCEHNQSCFSGDTKFITDAGVVRFDSIIPGSTVNVLGIDGQFVPAIVRYLGQQEIFNLRLKKGPRTKTIRTTANHLWPSYTHYQRFNSGDILRKTTELNHTMQLVSNFGDASKEMPFNLEAVMHGIVFGDGTVVSSGKNTHIYLCHESRELKWLFQRGGYKITERDDINQTRIYSLPVNWKELPGLDMSPDYLYWFIAGWFAADGHISADGRNSLISSIHHDNLEWIQKIGPSIGIPVSNHIGAVDNSKATFASDNPCFKLSLIKGHVHRTFFIREKHRSRLAKIQNEQSPKSWRVESIEPTGLIEPVYCVDEPQNHLFTIEDNILTHNCTITIPDGQWSKMQAEVWEARHELVAVSFLPEDGGRYSLLPEEAISEDEYKERKAAFPKINYEQLVDFEKEDETTGDQEYACMGGSCEIL